MKKGKRFWSTVDNRRSGRYANIGLEMEKEISSFLEKAQYENGEPIFERVVNHPSHSLEDQSGKDITVYRKVNGVLQERSFGVTISIKRWNETRRKHEGVCVFFTPVGYNSQSLLKKVLELF